MKRALKMDNKISKQEQNNLFNNKKREGDQRLSDRHKMTPI